MGWDARHSRYVLVVNQFRPLGLVMVADAHSPFLVVDRVWQPALEQVPKVHPGRVPVHSVLHLPGGRGQVIAAVFATDAVEFQPVVVGIVSSRDNFPLSETRGIDKIT